MKKNLLYTAAIAAAGLTLSPGSVRANVPVSSSYGDLILGFEAPGGTGSSEDLEVNLGPASQFLSATAPFTVTFGTNPSNSSTVTNLYSDLGIFGSSGAWASNTSLLWGVVGVIPNGTTSDDIFLTEDLTLATPIENPGNSTSRTWAADIKDIDSSSGLGGVSNDGYSTEAAVVTAGATNTWSEFSGSGFGSNKDIEQADGDSAIGSLELYEAIPPGSSANGSDATDVGSFTLNSAGSLTFTPAAVPEPSTWASIIGGSLFLAFFRRRGARAV